MASIPVVNLRDFTHGTAAERDRFVRAWGDGLREFGFVTVDGHGLPLDLIGNVFEVTHKLFALSEERKRAYIVPGTGGARGYTAYGKERAVGATVNDLKEFWHVGQEDVQGPLADLYPRNVWPVGSEMESFRPTVLEAFRSFEGVAQHLLSALAIYLELDADHFAQMARGGNSVMRLIHYPPVPEGAHPAAVRAAAHEDINLITLLCEATTGGLEVLRRDGTWMPIKSLNGQIIVDAGDMLQWATGGVIPATTHRVVNPDPTVNEARYSIPFFVHPRPEVVLQPAPTCADAPTASQYRPVTAHDYLTQRLEAIGLYDADPFTAIS